MLDKVKILIGIPDNEQDELLNTIIELTEQSLLSYLPDDTTEVPSNLSFIVTEITVKRYNRLGAEGVKKKTLEGLSMEFTGNDFDPYMSLISTGEQGGSTGEGQVMFF